MTRLGTLQAVTGKELAWADGTPDYYSRPDIASYNVLAIVTLDPGVQLELSENARNSSKPHKIINY